MGNAVGTEGAFGPALGAAIAWLRERRSLTRPELAAKVRQAARDDGEPNCGVDAKTIGRWENGQAPRPPQRRWLAAALGIPVEQLPGAGKLAREDKAETERREFARLATLGVVGAMLPGAVDWERIAALGRDTPPVDSRALDELEAIGASLGRLWKISPPAALLPAVHAHLGTLGNLAPAGTRSQALAADVASLAGYLAFQLEERGRASAYWSLARRLARDIGGETESRALIGASALHSTVADGGVLTPSRTALALLDAAEASAGPRASRLLRAWVLARRAEEHAALGDGYAADADLAAAGGCLRDPQPCADCIIGPRESSQLAGFQGSCAVLLGRYEDAAGVLRASLDTMPAGMVAWRSVVSADMGAALAGMNEVDAAADALSVALDLAAEAGAPEHARRVRGVRQRHLSRFADVPAVRHLDERLISVL
jgi:transcriptional regulator with XRE-family HTH domain